CMQALQTPYRF
nr:immunoglobulin light chain junction region [Macaca mulatta]MPN88538.1 immunoglobulin light chain junction region [Macaca mulatta]MPN89207.1 immunoglobulin light chain junction region [Macaca mulatta]MPN89836.1 immunoglobulin light chain junction region [Macaca mulatta]